MAGDPVVITEAGIRGGAVECRRDPEPGAGQVVDAGGVRKYQRKRLDRTRARIRRHRHGVYGWHRG